MGMSYYIGPAVAIVLFVAGGLLAVYWYRRGVLDEADAVARWEESESSLSDVAPNNGDGRWHIPADIDPDTIPPELRNHWSNNEKTVPGVVGLDGTVTSLNDWVNQGSRRGDHRWPDPLADDRYAILVLDPDHEEGEIIEPFVPLNPEQERLVTIYGVDNIQRAQDALQDQAIRDALATGQTTPWALVMAVIRSFTPVEDGYVPESRGDS